MRAASWAKAGKRDLASRKSLEKLPIYVMMVPTFLFLIVFMYYPALRAIYLSLFKWNGFTDPAYIGLDNYRRLLDDDLLQTSVGRLAFLTGASVLQLALPLFAAEMIFHLKSDVAQYLYRVLFVIPVVVPLVTSILIWRYIFDPSVGLANELLRNVGLGSWTNEWLAHQDTALLTLVLIGFPWIHAFNLLIFTAGLQAIPAELLDSAELDGARGLTRFRTIDFPLILGQVKLLVILTIIGSLQAFAFVLILTNGGPGTSTTVPGLVLYQSAFQYSRYGYATAIGTVIFVIILVLTVINLKFIKTSTEFEA